MSTPKQDAISDEFDQVLKELARPERVGRVFAAQVAAMTTHPLQGAAQLAAVEAGPASEPQIGDVLDGRYRILGVLGRGGMGVVLEAEQLRTHKVVAIKWMSSPIDDHRTSSHVTRFLREARAVANIQHPHVVDLYDVGDSNGTPFLVLERLCGESLRSRLHRGRLGWDEAVTIMTGVLAGVGAVHRAGIIHRDLKPDNIFLALDGDAITPKVLDFGVAAIRQNTRDDLDSLTRTGALLGTPSYMALEQLTGGEVDARSDLYALGVVLFEMLSGCLPFVARSAADLAVLQATREPPSISRLVPRLDARHDALLNRALARQVEQRFADAAAFAAGLRGVLDGRRPTRRSLRVGAAALVAGTALAGAITYAVQRVEAPERARPEATTKPALTMAQDARHNPATHNTPAQVAPSVMPPVETATTPVVRGEALSRPQRRVKTVKPIFEQVQLPPVDPPEQIKVAPERNATRIQVDDF